MSRNSGGTYSLPAGQPVVTGTTISATTFNTLTSDLATELTDSLSRSNKGAMLAALSLYVSGTKTAPSLTFDTDSDTGLYRIGANNPAISAGDTKVQDWTTAGTTITGLLGISGAAVYPLDVFGASGTQARFGSTVSSLAIESRTGVDPRIAGNSVFGSLDTYVANGFAGALQIPGATTGDFVFYTSPSGTAGGTATFTERFRITNTGAGMAVAKAWGRVTSNGAGGYTLNAGLNVSTVAADGSGKGIKVSFTTAIGSTTYAPVCSMGSGTNACPNAQSLASTDFVLAVFNGSTGAQVDLAATGHTINFAVFA